MIALVLAVWGSAQAGSPAVVGLPLARLDEIGLGAPTVSAVSGTMRYPLDDGYVVVAIAPDASQAFDGMARTVATHWAAGPSVGERSLGDGEGALLVQSEGAVVFVRDGAGHAADVAMRVLGAMTRDPADCSGDAVLGDVVAADGCGRPR